MDQAKIKELKGKLKVGNWTFSDEREFLENLFVGRFNYFIVIFSLFLTAGFANNFKNYKYLVFYFGFIVLSACWIPLFRAYKKHDRMMKLMFNDLPDHPAAIVEKIMEEEGFKPFFKVSHFMGRYIPFLCILILLLSGLLIDIGLFD